MISKRTILPILLIILFTFSPTTVLSETTDSSTQQESVVTINEGDGIVATTHIEDDAALAFFSQLASTFRSKYNVDLIGVNFSSRIAWFDEAVFNSMEFEERQEAIRYLQTEIKNSRLSPKGKNKIYNFIRNQDLDSNKVLRNLEKDVYADLEAGQQVTSFVNRPVSVFLGILSLFTFIGLLARFIMDILYMALPSVQYIVDTKFGDKKYFGKIVSNAARIGVKERDSGKYDPYALFTYFRRTIFSTLLLTVAFLWLVQGTIITFISEFVSAFSW